MALIPFGKPFPGIDSVSLRDGVAAGLVNGFINELKDYEKVPGHTLFSTVNTTSVGFGSGTARFFGGGLPDGSGAPADYMITAFPSNETYNLGMSWYAWVKRSAAGATLNALTGRLWDANNGWSIYLNASNQIVFRKDSAEATVASPDLSVWTFIGVTYDPTLGSNQVKFYAGTTQANIAQIGTATMTGTFVEIGSYGICLGWMTYGNAITNMRGWNGWIDQAGLIANKAMTLAELKAACLSGSESAVAEAKYIAAITGESPEPIVHRSGTSTFILVGTSVLTGTAVGAANAVPIVAPTDNPVPIDGLYETLAGTVLGVTGGQVFKLNVDGTYVNFTGATVTPQVTYYWSEDGQHVYLAHGSKLARLDMTNLTVTLLNENTPGSVTHVCRSKGYLLCNGTDVVISSVSWQLAQVFDDSTAFYSAVKVSGQDGYMVMAGSRSASPDNVGRLYLSKDNGLTWTKVHSVTSNIYCTGLCDMGGGVVLAGTGSTTGRILRSTDYGVTWSDLGQQGTATVCRFITKLAANTAIACVNANASSSGKIYRSTDNGATWTVLSTPADFGKHTGAVCNFGGGVVACAAINNSDVLHVWRSTDTGATFTDVETLASSALASLGGIALSSTVGLIAVQLIDGTSKIYRSTDAGANWTEIGAIDGKETYAIPVDFLLTSDSQLLFSTIGDGDPTHDGGAFIWKSTDLGVTWQKVTALDDSYSAATWKLVETHEAGTVMGIGSVLRTGAPSPPALGDYQQAKWQTGLTGGGAAPRGDVFYSEDKSNNYQKVDSWGFFNTEQSPDACNGVFEHRSLVYATGPRSVEINYNQADANQPWAFSDPSLPFGLLAPNSWVAWDQLDTIMYLTDTDNVIQVVRFRGRQQQQMSQEYAEVLNDRATITSPSTAKAWGIALRGMPHYVITFPADNLTLCYNLLTDHWWRWAYWNGTTYEAAIINSYCYWSAQNKHIVGDRRDNGRIYTLGGLTDNGDAIRFELTSGNVTRETDRLKVSNRIIHKTKRGQASDTSEPRFKVRFRDNGGKWGRYQNVSLGYANQDDFFAPQYQLGSYRARQVQIVHDDTKSDFIYSHADEDYVVARH